MADIKRLHYFDHQFLVEADFSDEQAYHLDMRRRHNSVLHTFGVAAGLQVEKTGDKEITVGAGTAVDREGHEMVLDADQVIDLSTFSAGEIYITIAYTEQETDPTTATGVTGNTRVTETPQIQAINVPPGPAPPGDGSVVRLANFTLTGGNVPGNNGDTFDAGLRQFAGSSVAPGSVGTDELADGAVNGSKIANNAVSNRTIQNLAVSGAKIANNTITSGNIANGTVSNEDIANNSINEAKFNAAARGKLVTNGNNHNHAGGDGGQINHSDINKNDGRNPHGTNAADVGAMPSSGGTVTGTLEISKAGATAARFGPAGSVQNLFGQESGRSVSVFVSAQPSPNVGTSTKTAMMIWPVTSGYHGLVLLSAGGGVDTMTVNGTARFTGTKIGYVVDTFVNASGKTLHTGDIVRLKSSGVVRFQGDNNLIPITEVTLADTENDPLVIGIVAKEATPPPDEPDTRSEPDDPTFIPDGGDLFVVTLGTFAHGKVDASEAPIEVGDLLTTSAIPGHAKKATEPKIGSIIGKALEPLKEGTGYISVFVNIQ